jgi:hypothetical protein
MTNSNVNITVREAFVSAQYDNIFKTLLTCYIVKKNLFCLVPSYLDRLKNSRGLLAVEHGNGHQDCRCQIEAG